MKKLKYFTLSLIWYTLLIFPMTNFSQSQYFQSTLGPYGGGVFDVWNEDEVCYITNQNGLYKTNSNGQVWERFDQDLPQFYTANSFCAQGQELFLVLIDQRTSVQKIMYSQDAGISWNEINSPETKGYIIEMAFQDGVFLVKQGSEIYETRDYGRSWSKLNFASMGGIIKIKSNRKFFFISNSKELYRRPIHGDSMSLVLSTSVRFYDFHLSDQTLIVLRDRLSGFVSTNNGDDWESTNIDAYNGEYVIAEFEDSLFYLKFNELYASPDLGKNWTKISTLRDNNRFTNIMKLGKILAFNHYLEGIYYSEDQFKTFHGLNFGIRSSSSYRITQNKDYLFSASQYAVSRFDKKTEKWDTHYVHHSFDLVKNILANDEILAIVTYNSLPKIYISFDNGKSLEAYDLPYYLVAGNFYSWVKGFINDSLIFLMGSYPILSKDKGKTWSEYKLNFKGSKARVRDIIAVGDSLVLALTELPGNLGYQILRSNNLVDWNLVAEYKEPVTISFLENPFYWVDGHLFIKGFCGNELYFYKYDASANKWNIVIRGAHGFTYGVERMLKLNDGDLLINLAQGLMHSDDGGENWSMVLDQISLQNGNLYPDMLLERDRIYFGTNHFGVIYKDQDFLGEVFVGKLFYDKNNNLSYDQNDKLLQGTYLKLKGKNNFISTNSKGEYKILYAMDSPDSLITVHHFKHGNFIPHKLALYPSNPIIDFAFQIQENINDVAIKAYEIPAARPGFEYRIAILITNHGSNPWNGNIGLQFDNLFEYLSTSKPFIIKRNNSILWQLDNLLPLEQIIIYVDFHLDQNVALATKFEHHGWATSTLLSELDSTDNRFIINSEVVASIDPNDILVDRKEINNGEFESGVELEYTVRFQNTGNYPAEFVQIDIPFYKFDEMSLRITGSSHPYKYNMSIVGNDLKFIFDQIHLADSSSDEKNSHGFISFKVKPMKNYFNQGVFENFASIVFDYNSPIRTNNAITKITEATGVFNDKKKEKINHFLAPNPVHRMSSIQLYGNQLDRIVNLKVTDLLGINQKVRIISKSENFISADISALKPGVYQLSFNHPDFRPATFIVVE